MPDNYYTTALRNRTVYELRINDDDDGDDDDDFDAQSAPAYTMVRVPYERATLAHGAFYILTLSCSYNIYTYTHLPTNSGHKQNRPRTSYIYIYDIKKKLKYIKYIILYSVVALCETLHKIIIISTEHIII